jgi:hypothetical protein
LKRKARAKAAKEVNEKRMERANPARVFERRQKVIVLCAPTFSNRQDEPHSTIRKPSPIVASSLLGRA